MASPILRWARVVVASLFVAGAPIAVADYVLGHHALAEARVETRAMAERYLERSEEVIGEGLTILRDLKNDGHVTCSFADRQVFGARAFTSTYIQQVGLADARGTLLCGEPMGSLHQPIRLPASERGDPSVMIGVLTDGKADRQAFVLMKLDDDARLVARVNRSALDFVTGPDYLSAAQQVAVYLDDGSTWMSRSGTWSPEKEPDNVAETAVSSRYPLRVSVTVSSAAAHSTVAPLRAIILIGSAFLGLMVFGWGAVLVMRGDSGGDVFTRAVANQEFIPYYQPVFDIFTGELKGCEVLVRWQRPDGSMVPPGQFLPYAEATGLIREITTQLMLQTVDDCAELYSRNRSLKLSINLTAMHFVDLRIVDEIRSIYQDSGIVYEQLCFEVTEQHPLKDLTLSRTIIQRIQALGAQVALDDVGTGHGGLAYLQKLGVDIIKIDKMFIDNISTDHSSQSIVETLVELGHQLGLGIIAEGVERVEQVEHLKGIGVTTAQGYLFAKPLPAKAYLELAATMTGSLAAPPADAPGDAPTGEDETEPKAAA
ncbi:EAL domain-containing protein [Chthonobacter rhizosphaerae]|uniref:EAL domain-containing protein n=1 Tax=Chthonobacter rhizosphaerae TaxID=2735553 RepID=UPI0015EFD417|nr:EAL domain-containing protein [Chthonobacter rhizosphaerae]